MKKIQIDSIDQKKAQFGVQITLVSGKEKYSFFNTKKDGSNSKAYEQFSKFGFKIGDIVEAEVKEEDKSFPDTKTGKMVKYTQRTIIFFNEIENTPTVTRATQMTSTQVTTSDLEARVKKLEDAVFGAKEVEDDNTVLADLKAEENKGIKAEDIPFN